MSIQGSAVYIPGEVTIASSMAGAPRLDFSRFSAFDIPDEASKSALPRSKSSNDILSHAMREGEEDNSRDGSWEIRRGRPRNDSERHNMGDLIDFLRDVSPPPQNYLPSAFDDDADTVQEPPRWRQWKEKFRRRLQKDNATYDDGQFKAKTPEATIAAKTSRGHAHIAIPVPMEHCPLGPDSVWATPSYNITKPLPPSPPLDARDRLVKIFGNEKGGVSAPGSAHGEGDWISLTSRGAFGKSHAKEPKPTAMCPWQYDSPISPPRSATGSPSPPCTAPGSAHDRPATSTSTEQTRVFLPMDPAAHFEMLKPPFPPPKGSDSVHREETVEVPLSLQTTAHLPRSPPTLPPPPTPLPARPSTTPKRPNRPKQLKLPARKSSLKNQSANTKELHNQDSIDRLVASGTQDNQGNISVENAEPSPSLSEETVSSCLQTDGSEPIVSSARAVRGYSNASIIVHTTPRASLAGPSEADSPPTTPEMTPASSATAPVRRTCAKTTGPRQNRAERVKSLKQRDMEKALARSQSRRQTPSLAVDRDGEHSFREADTCTNLTRRMSKNVTPGPPCISKYATQFPQPPMPEPPTEDDVFGGSSAGHDATLLHPKRYQGELLGISGSRSSSSLSANGRPDSRLGERDSSSSFEPPRRYDSFHRTSWASSIPILDRISSYAPSEASFMQILDSVTPEQGTHRRSDSATLPRMELERLAPSRLSQVPDVPDLPSSSTHMVGSDEVSREVEEEELSEATRLGADPGIGGPDAQPLAATPSGERWSATTLNSTNTVVPALSPASSISNESNVNSSSREATPPQTPREHSMQCTIYGPPAPVVSEHSALAQLQRTEVGGLEHMQQQPGYAYPSSWTPTEAQDLDISIEDPESMVAEYQGFSQQRGSFNSLRMSAGELRAHYAALRRSERASDLAHHMLLNQERLELDMRRQEHNQILFFSSLERTIGDLTERLPPPSSGQRSTLGWCEEEEEGHVADDEAAGPSRQQSVASKDSKMRKLRLVEEHQQDGASAVASTPLQSSRTSRRRLSREPQPLRGPRYIVSGPGGSVRLSWQQSARQRQRQRQQSQSSSQGSQGSLRLGHPGSPATLQQKRQQARHGSINGANRSLDSIEPLIRELQGTSRVSLEGGF